MTAQPEIPREMVLAFVEAYEAAPSAPWDEDKSWRDQEYPEVEAGLRAVLEVFAERLTSDEAAEIIAAEFAPSWPGGHGNALHCAGNALERLATALVPGRGQTHG